MNEPEQEQAYWTPWEPKPGDRVRIRLSAECRVKGPGNSLNKILDLPHHPMCDGKTGVVIAPSDLSPPMPLADLALVYLQGHTVLVLLDEPFPIRLPPHEPWPWPWDVTVTGDVFAPSELEPVVNQDVDRRLSNRRRTDKRPGGSVSNKTGGI